MSVYRNSEGYYDPTAGRAIAQVLKDQSKVKERRRYRPLVYVCSPYSGDVIENTYEARRYCRFAVAKGYIPIAAHLHFPQFLSEKDPEERKLGIFFGKVLMDKCDEVWLFGERHSEGMQAEYAHAVKKGHKIRLFTKNCKEITRPDGGGGDGSV